MQYTLDTLIKNVHTKLYKPESKNKDTSDLLLHSADLSQLLSEDKSLTILERMQLASAGDRKSRDFIIDEIYKTLIKDYKYIVTHKTIDGFIEEYHLNYFQPVYEGDFKDLYDDINAKLCISKNAQFKDKLYKLSRIIYQENYGLSVLDDLLDFSPFVNEVGANAVDYIWIQYKGMKVYLPKFKFQNEEVFREVCKKAISYDAKSDLNEVTFEVLCQRFNGSRVTALNKPYCETNQLNIRNFNISTINKENYIKNKASSPEFEKFIDLIMPGRPNIVIIGDMGTGKTSYLLRLVDSYPEYLAIGTMETMFELNIAKTYAHKNLNVVALQTLPNKNAEQVFATFLRLNRDVIICGEVREVEEAIVMLKAMLRQGRGSMCTFHSTSVRDFPYDYRNLLMQSNYYKNEETAMLDVARAVDIVIHLKLDRRTGKRNIGEVAELIADFENQTVKVNTIFKYNKQKETLEPVNPVSEQFLEKLTDFDIPDDNIRQIKELFNR